MSRAHVRRPGIGLRLRRLWSQSRVERFVDLADKLEVLFVIHRDEVQRLVAFMVDGSSFVLEIHDGLRDFRRQVELKIIDVTDGKARDYLRMVNDPEVRILNLVGFEQGLDFVVGQSGRLELAVRQAQHRTPTVMEGILTISLRQD